MTQIIKIFCFCNSYGSVSWTAKRTVNILWIHNWMFVKIKSQQQNENRHFGVFVIVNLWYIMPYMSRKRVYVVFTAYNSNYFCKLMLKFRLLSIKSKIRQFKDIVVLFIRLTNTYRFTTLILKNIGIMQGFIKEKLACSIFNHFCCSG